MHFPFTSEIHNFPPTAGKLLKSKCDERGGELPARWAGVAMAVECLRATECHPAVVVLPFVRAAINILDGAPVSDSTCVFEINELAHINTMDQ